MFRYLPAFFAWLLIAAAVWSPAAAETLRFSHAGRAAGTLGGGGFVETDFVITAEGDTTAWQFLPGFGDDIYTLENLSATVSIDGVGEFAISTPTRTFVNETTGLVGLTRGFANDLFYGPTDAFFTQWDRSSAAPTVSGVGEVLLWGTSNIQTSGGVLVFADTLSPVSFSAATIPEPVSLGLLAWGAASGAWLTARRR